MKAFLPGSQSKFLLRLAARLSIIYFVLRAVAPPTFVSPIDTRAYGSTTPWWVPVWPIDQVFWGQAAYGIGSPLMVLALAFALFGALGLRQTIISKKAYRYLTTATVVVIAVLLVTGVVFTALAFPNLELGTVSTTPAQWQMPLFALFTFVAIVSFAVISALVLVLVQSKRLAVWAGIAFILGVIVINANWFTLFFAPEGGLLSLGVFLVGIGWGIGLWHLGYVVNGEPVTSNWPKLPSWRKVVLGAVWLVVIWALVVTGIFAWDSRHAGALCQGSREITKQAGGSTVVKQNSDEYSFSYTISPDMPWKGNRANTEASNYCGLTTNTWPDWMSNRAWNYIPIYREWLGSFIPAPPKTSAYFAVIITKTKFDNLDEYRVDYERHQSFHEKNSGVSPNTQSDLGRAQLSGREALLMTTTNKGQNFTSSVASSILIAEGKQYQVGWSVVAESEGDLNNYLQAHRAELEAMVQSFKLK